MMHLLRRLRLNGVPAAAAVLLLAGCSPDGASATEAFPVDRFLESEANFAGNRYRLRASIDKQLGWEEGTGRVVVVKPGPGSRCSYPHVSMPASTRASVMKWTSASQPAAWFTWSNCANSRPVLSL